MSGVHFTHTVKQHDAGVQLVIETPDASMNAGIFERLEAQRVAAEEDFGGPPEWDRVEGCKKCKNRADAGCGGYLDEDRWPEIQEALIDAMIRLEAAFRPRIEGVRSP